MAFRISSINTISYEKIAEARIIYGGKGQLTDAQMMHMLGLPEGEITTDPVPEVKSSETPAADVTASNDDQKAAEPTPVLLAKDGVHTIPYDKLVEARTAEAHWKQVAAEAQAQLDAAVAAANEARKPGAPEVTAENVNGLDRPKDEAAPASKPKATASEPDDWDPFED